MAEDSREPATAYLHIGDLICLRLEVRSLANQSHLLHPWEPESAVVYGCAPPVPNGLRAFASAPPLPSQDLGVSQDTTEDQQLVGSVGFFGNEQAGVSNVDGRSNKHNHVFLVRQQHKYSEAAKLRKQLEAEGLKIEQVRGDPKFDSEIKRREREREQNLREFKQAAGREVRYGTVLQLQHEATHKYLSVSRQPAQLKDARRVILDREAAEAGWFRVLPKLRVVCGCVAQNPRTCKWAPHPLLTRVLACDRHSILRASACTSGTRSCSRTC